MKRFFLVIAAVFMTVFGAACSAGDAALNFDKPWGDVQMAYEKSVYKVEIFERVAIKDSKGKITGYENGELLASGNMETELNTAGVDADNEAFATTNYSVTWIDSEKAEENSKKTDRITSEVSFRTETLKPKKVSKTVALEDREIDGKHVNNSYKFNADYSTKKSVISFGKEKGAQDGEYITIDKQFSTGGDFDNEQAFYLLRAFKNFGSSVQNNFTFNSVYNRYLYSLRGDKFSPFEMVAAVDGEKTQIDTDGFIFDILDGREDAFNTLIAEFETIIAESDKNTDFKNAMQAHIDAIKAARDKTVLEDMQTTLDALITAEEDAESAVKDKTVEIQNKLNALFNCYKVDCYGTSMVINADKSGPAHRFFISDPALKFGANTTTNKVVFKYEYMLYNRTDLTEKYHYVYTLTDYTNVPEVPAP